MCTVLLPLGDNPIAVNKYILYIIPTKLHGVTFQKTLTLSAAPPTSVEVKNGQIYITAPSSVTSWHVRATLHIISYPSCVLYVPSITHGTRTAMRCIKAFPINSVVRNLVEMRYQYKLPWSVSVQN